MVDLPFFQMGKNFGEISDLAKNPIIDVLWLLNAFGGR
jgi:hypothetical protein